VIVSGRSEAEGKQVAADIIKSGGDATYVYCDISRDEDVEAVFSFATEVYGGVDYVMANSGQTGPYVDDVVEIDPMAVQKLFDVNVAGLFTAYIHAVKAFRKYAYIHTYIHTCIHTCIHTYMHTYTHAYMHTYIHTYTHTYTHTYNIRTYNIHTHIHAYIHTCIHTYIHTYIQTTYTCIHTYIYAYIHACIHACAPSA
jgi:NADP-dependent 3-hydroxy acid dehydrogenase YdfG